MARPPRTASGTCSTPAPASCSKRSKRPAPDPHDGVSSADGKLLALGDRNDPLLPIYNTQTHRLFAQVGPFLAGVRPNTINGSDTISFVTVNGFDGFQVGSIALPHHPVLYTEGFGRCRGPFTTCSHGISLSVDSRRLYVIDTVHKVVQVWDVHGVADGIAPEHVANVPVDGLEGDEHGCTGSCQREGWLQATLDGRYVLAGDTGDVIDRQRHRRREDRQPAEHTDVRRGRLLRRRDGRHQRPRGRRSLSAPNL